MAKVRAVMSDNCMQLPAGGWLVPPDAIMETVLQQATQNNEQDSMHFSDIVRYSVWSAHEIQGMQRLHWLTALLKCSGQSCLQYDVATMSACTVDICA